jgi:hypothetical protein
MRDVAKNFCRCRQLRLKKSCELAAIDRRLARFYGLKDIANLRSCTGILDEQARRDEQVVDALERRPLAHLERHGAKETVNEALQLVVLRIVASSAHQAVRSKRRFCGERPFVKDGFWSCACLELTRFSRMQPRDCAIR